MVIFPMIHHYQTAHVPFTPSEKLHFLQSAGWAETLLHMPSAAHWRGLNDKADRRISTTSLMLQFTQSLYNLQEQI